jgi:hypothetical protein
MNQRLALTDEQLARAMAMPVVAHRRDIYNQTGARAEGFMAYCVQA